MNLKQAWTRWTVRKVADEFQRREATLDSWIADGYERDVVIRALAIVCRAFRLSETDAHRLRSGDQVWALYRHFYPRRTGWRRFFDMPVDELEMETLQRDFQKAVSIGRTVDLHRSVTLGDLARLLAR